MATVILTAVGTALGGPIGGAIGAFIGQSVDSRIFSTGSAKGPRLKELDVQTSSYGTQIPAIYGRMRTAGSVIWATDLIERKRKQGGGKGRPGVTTYSYSANFAVALSSRPISDVRRIWADGKLLRGVAGDFKTTTGFRLYFGTGDQPVDPLLASAQGAALTTAHRDLAYAVFEGLALEDYGNRIPSLTFEIVQRDGGVDLTEIVADASNGRVNAASGFRLDGYALSGQTLRDAIAPAVDVGGLMLDARSVIARLVRPGPAAGTIAVSELIAGDGTEGGRGPERRLAPLTAAPVAVALRHYEESRDYQSGMQTHFRPGPGTVTVQVDFPAVVSAARARELAAQTLLRRYRGRETISLEMALGDAAPRCADIIAIDGYGNGWQVEEVEHKKVSARVTARRSATSDMSTFAATPGSAVGQDDSPVGPTSLVLLDLPNMTEPFVDHPLIAVAAGGGSAAWRRVGLEIDRGAGFERWGVSAPAALIGDMTAAPGTASPCILDRRNRLEIKLRDASAALSDADDAALASGANLAWAGGEIVQFRDAAPLGGGSFRLTQLTRGMFGTDDAIATHVPGETFVLLDRDTLITLDGAGSQPGQLLSVLAEGIGDATPVIVDLNVSGLAVQPLACVHPAQSITDTGGLRVNWTRRARHFVDWRDGVDMPLVEDSEAYVVQISDAGGITLSERTVSVPELQLTPAEVATLAASLAQPLSCIIRQQGRWMLSPPLTFALTLPV